MTKSIEIDIRGVAYCTLLHDGRVEKFFLKNERRTIYCCEECEAMWISLEDMFTKEKTELLEPYIRSLGYTERLIPKTWEKIAEFKGFLTIADISDVVQSKGIKIVHI